MATGPHDDPISSASSGLRALGVAPQRRIETLGLLSALLDLADETGEVLLDSALIETEERLGIDACLEGYEWLERLDVIRRTWSGWMITNFAAHHGPVGMTAASMAVLQRHLNANEDVPVVALVPSPVVEETAAVVPLRTWRRRLPAVAASVAAGVAVLAGATQFVPQAAVTARNAAVQTEGTAAATASSVVDAATSSTPTAPTALGGSPSTVATSEPVATTTTSSTLLPGLPCLSDTLDNLGTRTGLLTDRSTVLPPGVLPCP